MVSNLIASTSLVQNSSNPVRHNSIFDGVKSAIQLIRFVHNKVTSLISIVLIIVNQTSILMSSDLSMIFMARIKILAANSKHFEHFSTTNSMQDFLVLLLRIICPRAEAHN